MNMLFIQDENLLFKAIYCNLSIGQPELKALVSNLRFLCKENAGRLVM